MAISSRSNNEFTAVQHKYPLE